LHDQGQPVLGLRLQRRRHTARGRRAPEPDAGRGCDGALQRVRGDQQLAPPEVRNQMTSTTSTDHGHPRPGSEAPTRGYTMTKDAYAKRLNRIEGQVRGIRRMIEDDAY